MRYNTLNLRYKTCTDFVHELLVVVRDLLVISQLCIYT